MNVLRLSAFLFILNFFSAQSTPLQWEFLQEGDKINVLAQSYGNDTTKQYLATAKTVIQENGFKLDAPDDLISPQALEYANTVQYRQEHLKKVLLSEETKVVWTMRGGRGASGIILSLDGLSSPSKVKLILGFSDATALHLLAAKWGWPSLHCPVLAYNQEIAPAVNKATSLKLVFDILSGKTQEVSYTLSRLNKVAQSSRESMTSSIVGGNASVVQRSIGTETHLKTNGKILFLEDTGEPATKFLEIMTHFQRARLFESVKAIILGDFKSGLSEAQCTDLGIAKNQFLETMTTFNIPVLGSEHFGHGDLNYPLPFGTLATLNFQSSGEVDLRVKTNN